MLNYFKPIFNRINSFYNPFTLVIDTTLGSNNFMTLPLFGKHRVFIDWGDGSPREKIKGDSPYDAIHEYAVPGEYTIKMWGKLEGYGLESGNRRYPNSEKIKKCLSFGELGIKSLSRAFSGGLVGDIVNSNIIEVPKILPSSVRELEQTFQRAVNLNDPNITYWDTSNVENLNSIFRFCSSFNQNINTKVVTNNKRRYVAWDVKNGINFNSMFAGASVFNQPLNCWNMSNATSIASMFQSAQLFNQDINTQEVTVGGKSYIAWNTSNVMVMNGLFFSNESFNQSIDKWNTSKVTYFGLIFAGSTTVGFRNSFNQPLETKKVTVGNKTYIAWDVSNADDFVQLFQNNISFNQDLSSWDTSKVRRMATMFSGAVAFNNGQNPGIDNVGIGVWDTSSLGIGRPAARVAANMFNGAISFNQDLSGWCVTNVDSASPGFSSNTPAWDKTNRVPVWGTCPS
jgi:surface protein